MLTGFISILPTPFGKISNIQRPDNISFRVKMERYLFPKKYILKWDILFHRAAGPCLLSFIWREATDLSRISSSSRLSSNTSASRKALLPPLLSLSVFFISTFLLIYICISLAGLYNRAPKNWEWSTILQSFAQFHLVSPSFNPGKSQARLLFAHWVTIFTFPDQSEPLGLLNTLWKIQACYWERPPISGIFGQDRPGRIFDIFPIIICFSAFLWSASPSEA